MPPIRGALGVPCSRHTIKGTDFFRFQATTSAQNTNKFCPKSCPDATSFSPLGERLHPFDGYSIHNPRLLCIQQGAIIFHLKYLQGVWSLRSIKRLPEQPSLHYNLTGN